MDHIGCEYIGNLLSRKTTPKDLEPFDLYETEGFGLLIPTKSPPVSELRISPRHPSYMAVIYFEKDAENMNYYFGEMISPDIPHDNKTRLHYYCLLFEKEFFERVYAMYSEVLPLFKGNTFRIYGDILRDLNSFALEYARHDCRCEKTLPLRAELIVHKVVRGILMDRADCAKPISDDFSVAAAQNYMEVHYGEDMNVTSLSLLGYEMTACFMRRFKKETGVTPLDYLYGVRLHRAARLLKDTNMKIREIAGKCGFQDEERLRTKFVEKYGVSPRTYRRLSGRLRSASEEIDKFLPDRKQKIKV